MTENVSAWFSVFFFVWGFVMARCAERYGYHKGRLEVLEEWLDYEQQVAEQCN